MTRQDVPPLLTLSGAVLEAQWDRVGHITLSDRCRRPVGREKKKKPRCLIFGTRTIVHDSFVTRTHWITRFQLQPFSQRSRTPTVANSRHVRAIPWPSGRWPAWRRSDTGHAGRLHSRERARGHVQPLCRGRGNVGREKRCRRRHRSGGGSPASRDADGRGFHSAAQRTSNRAGRWQADGPPQQKPARRHDHPRVIAGAFNPRSRCARSPRPTLGGGGW